MHIATQFYMYSIFMTIIYMSSSGPVKIPAGAWSPSLISHLAYSYFLVLQPLDLCVLYLGQVLAMGRGKWILVDAPEGLQRAERIGC